MQNVSIWRRALKIVSLLVVSIGICLHIYLQYPNPLLAGITCAAVVIINVICIRLLCPHAWESNSQARHKRNVLKAHSTHFQRIWPLYRLQTRLQ